MDTLRLTKKTTPRQIRAWIRSTNTAKEKSGSANESGTLFRNNGNCLATYSFHTHPDRYGFQPPSVRDLETLINNPVVKKHWILTLDGIYAITIKCNMSQRTRESLLRKVRYLKKTMYPSAEHHQRWMKTVNGAHPRCFKVEYTPY